MQAEGLFSLILTGKLDGWRLRVNLSNKLKAGPWAYADKPLATDTQTGVNARRNRVR